MSDFLKQAPLGQTTDYVDRYDPALLFPVPRHVARDTLSQPEYPFRGGDWWTAYELSWLLPSGLPRVAIADIWVPAGSQYLVESKSLKLYLNGFANTVFSDEAQVGNCIAADLSALLRADVKVSVSLSRDQHSVVVPNGTLIDDLPFDGDLVDGARVEVMPGANREKQVLVSHLLRSRCPVTGQPDWASVIIEYEGISLDASSLLRFVVSLRNHQGFHEQVIERIFLEILEQCSPDFLAVYGRFTRRGGIDINPYRTTGHEQPENIRLVRQ